tara:strand:- start:4116 stop:4589 length:474 start_codon:yes stop_codon:yes gene_type:complete
MNARGQKHIINCRCILPTLKNRANPPTHKFVVFSIIDYIDGDEKVREKYAQCNNCGVVHRVFELGKSEIMSNREDLSSCLTIEDISLSLPEDVRNILESYRSDLATYEQISFLVENSSPGHIVLSKEENDSRLEGKLLKYNGKTFKIEPFATQVGLK